MYGVEKKALNIGLIDELGDMHEATEWIAEKCNLTDYEIVEYPKKKSFYEELISELRGGISETLSQLILGEKYHYHKIIKQIRQIDPVQAQMENIEIE